MLCSTISRLVLQGDRPEGGAAMPSITTDELVEVQTMIRKLKKQEIVSKPRTEKLIEQLRRDLHTLAIETEGLVAVGRKKRVAKRFVQPNETVL
jgi:hypothetical protein